jgi:hypothetical protein
VEFLEKHEHRSAKSSFQFRFIKQAKAITRRNHYFRGKRLYFNTNLYEIFIVEFLEKYEHRSAKSLDFAL